MQISMIFEVSIYAEIPVMLKLAAGIAWTKITGLVLYLVEVIDRKSEFTLQWMVYNAPTLKCLGYFIFPRSDLFTRKMNF